MNRLVDSGWNALLQMYSSQAAPWLRIVREVTAGSYEANGVL
ncbi:hypothetical protein [Dyella psychrodurans]|nr:hypothetical protein [Dyella psychrodurans]